MKRILELTGRDESLIEYVTDRPGHDRRYSLVRRRARGLGWSAGRSHSTRESSEPSTGTATTRTGGAPIRSGEYREYYERQYGKALK